MKRVLCLLIVVSILATNSVFAGPYSDALAKKLVSSTKPEEKALFVRWMFFAMTLHPDLKDLSKVTTAQREEVNQAIAQLMTRMLTETCAVEAREAVRYEGIGAIEGAFNVFGQIAGRELVTNPEVAAGLADLQKHFDSKAIEEALIKQPLESQSKGQN